MARALVLVGHGSSKNPNTRKPICHIVNEIRKRGLFAEVRCGLLKQDPRVCKCLDPLESDEIVVVPFFISDGYYTRSVIPTCIGLKDQTGKRIRYTRAVGSHPLFAELILKHAEDAGWQTGDALVVMGHGTPKNPASGINVYLQAERIRQMHPREEIVTTFIDEAPYITQVWTLCQSRNIFVVPLFIGDGWHVTETIPEDLGLVDGQALQGARRLWLTPAVGTDPRLIEVVLALAE
jgi:sirohydrochlorin cobaltochelatase